MSTVLHETANKAAQELASKLGVPLGTDLSELALLYEQLMVNNNAGGAGGGVNELWTEATMAEAFGEIQEFPLAPRQSSPELQQAMAKDLTHLMPDVQALISRHVGPVAEGGKNPLALVSALSSALAFVAVSNGMHPAVFMQTIAGAYGQTMNQVQAGFQSSAVVKDAQGNVVQPVSQ